MLRFFQSAILTECRRPKKGTQYACSRYSDKLLRQRNSTTNGDPWVCFPRRHGGHRGAIPWCLCGCASGISCCDRDICCCASGIGAFVGNDFCRESRSFITVDSRSVSSACHFELCTSLCTSLFALGTCPSSSNSAILASSNSAILASFNSAILASSEAICAPTCACSS